MKTFPRTLLWFATIWSAIWFGGQLFNALMIVPHFSRNPPDSLRAWGQMRFDNLADFFVLFAPLWVFIALVICVFLSRGIAGRIWIIASACAAAIAIGMLFWMVPIIAGLVQSPGTDAPAMVARLHQWTIANWIRLLIDFVMFITALRALTLADTRSGPDLNVDASD